MYISQFKLGNFKSYYDSDPLAFLPGFNIIAGQNNAGKTALLEALGLDLEGKPHRSLRTLPKRDAAFDERSWLEVAFVVPIAEVFELIFSLGNASLEIPLPALNSPIAREIGFATSVPDADKRFLRWIFSHEFLTFRLKAERRVGAGGPNWSLPALPSFGLYEARMSPAAHFDYIAFHVDPGGDLVPHGGRSGADRTDFGLQLVPVLVRHVYRFTAERMNVGKGGHGGSTFLLNNASNLPEVLNQLQHNRTRFRALNLQLNRIMPQVREVTVRGVSKGEVEIVVWSHDPESQRDDLAIPLSESGTGIGQVLAILYVVMISERPQTIIIDEPQSFLHPGAARKLIEFLKSYPQHQYIIATHSPTIISAADPETITLARFQDGETVLGQLDPMAERSIQGMMADLGVRLSDVFGVDNVLWVEGQTEERCFPLIVEKILKKPLLGTAILGVRQTGDLEARDARRVFEIYDRLSRGSSLLPPALAFILDDECRNEQDKKELVRMSGGLARFLPRRMFENYLLNPKGISAIANSIEGFSPQQITEEAVKAELESRLTDGVSQCRMKDRVPGNAKPALSVIDGYRILKEVFAVLSETRVAYSKVRHGVALVEWLIENSPEDLSEISELLSGVLKDGGVGI